MKKQKLVAFHGKVNEKEILLKQLQDHYDQDEIIKGEYWEKGKGCAVGCTIHSDKHNKYESRLGIPEWVARLEDRLFEGMENADSKEFPSRLIKAIPVGFSNWKHVYHKLYIHILEKECKNIDHELVKNTFYDVIELHKRESKNKKLWSTAWSVAESAADAASESASRSAVKSVSRSVAESASWAARSAAESAAESAGSAIWSAKSAAWSARSAAESAAWAAEAEVWSARSAAWLSWSVGEAVEWFTVWSDRSSIWTKMSARSAESEVKSEKSAESDARSAARSAASAAYKSIGDKLIELLEKEK